jgi:solute carrier family 15 (oligopeptide transporter), member 1
MSQIETSPSPNPSPEPVPTTHPPAILFFFWGELAERSSYYGMRAILFLYLTTALRIPDTEASPIYAAFKMGCYLLPLLGGLIADRWLGRYWTIVGFSVPYVLGHFVLGFSDPTVLGGAMKEMSPERLSEVARWLLFISLALLAGGSGVIKPNISSLLGQTYDQKRPGQERLRSSAFLWFYLAINVGALISQLAMPQIRDRYIIAHLDEATREQAKALVEQGEDISKLASPEVVGRAYQLAFAFPTGLMALSLVLFAVGKRTYADERAMRQNQTAEERRQGFEMLLFIFGIYGLFTLYFLFDQLGLPAIREWYILGHLDPDMQAKARALIAEGKADDICKLAPQICDEWAKKWKMLAQAAAIGVTLAAVVALIARSVITAGRRTFAAEKHNGIGLTPDQQRQHLKTLAYLLTIFGLVIFFWFGYEHNDTLWISFTRDYVNLKVPFAKSLVGKDSISADQLQFLNALFVIILVPVFNTVFKYLDPDTKVFTAMRKILVGFFLTAAAVGIMAVAGYLTQGHTTKIQVGDALREICPEGDKVSFLWPAVAYIVLTFGEVLLYGTMLDLSYSAAPKSMKGYVTACFLLTNTLGNFLNILWMPLYGGSLPDAESKRGPIPPGLFFAITAWATVAAAIAFFFVGKRFDRSRRTAGISAT